MSWSLQHNNLHNVLELSCCPLSMPLPKSMAISPGECEVVRAIKPILEMSQNGCLHMQQRANPIWECERMQAAARLRCPARPCLTHLTHLTSPHLTHSLTSLTHPMLM